MLIPGRSGQGEDGCGRGRDVVSILDGVSRRSMQGTDTLDACRLDFTSGLLSISEGRRRG
jgi:hypothetical protein